MKLVVDVYRLGSRLPSKEAYGLIGQMTRSAASVPANIAEGHARGTQKGLLPLSVDCERLTLRNRDVCVAGHGAWVCEPDRRLKRAELDDGDREDADGVAEETERVGVGCSG